MKIKRLSSRIEYIEASFSPVLSAESFLIDSGKVLFDVGNIDADCDYLSSLKDKSVVISHFHADHMGALNKISNIRSLYGSKETLKHAGYGIEVDDIVNLDDVMIFPLPSSHCKGCLGLLVEDILLVGDALGGMEKQGSYCFNAQKLKELIDTLEKVNCRFIVESHEADHIRKKEDAIQHLEEIYSRREKNNPWIPYTFGK